MCGYTGTPYIAVRRISADENVHTLTVSWENECTGRYKHTRTHTDMHTQRDITQVSSAPWMINQYQRAKGVRNTRSHGTY